jgi:large subunit ribosomal protein L4
MKHLLRGIADVKRRHSPMKVKVKTLDNKAAGDITLAMSVFAVAPRADIVARVVNWQLGQAPRRYAQGEESCEIASTRR